MANWSLPGLTDLYTNILTYISNRLNDVALMLDSATTSPTNLPVGAKRWNSTNKYWETWSGSAWAPMASTYGISISGNANTATTLATARTINGVSFNGSANITINAVDATPREAAITAGTTLQYWRGDKTWQTMPTSLPANGGTSAACSGNSATATKFATARTINGVSFDGTANITINAVDATPREAAITVGTALQYWRGDKTWQTMPTSLPANGGTSAACSGNSETATTALNANNLGGQPPSYYTNSAVATQAEAVAGISNTATITPLGLRYGLNAAGSAPIYACRAWVNFDGTGTVSIRASGNVSSVTDNGTGQYSINFITGMPHVNYSVGGGLMLVSGYIPVMSILSRSTSVLSVTARNGSGSYIDTAESSVNIFV